MNAEIGGIGSTAFSSESGRSELELAVEAIESALADAGLRASDIDGIVKYSSDSNAAGVLIRRLGIDGLTFFGEVPYGGSACCGVVAHAAAAVDAGIASCVVCFRALNGRSGTRLGRGERYLSLVDGVPTAHGEDVPGGAYAAPFGLIAPVHSMALWTRRYQAVHGLSDERLADVLGTVAVTQRAYAQQNPQAVTYRRPLSLEEYRAGRPIATPLRLYDVCRETDGAVALVVVRPARRSPRGVRVLAARQHLFAYGEPVPVFTDDVTRLVPEPFVRDLYSAAGVGPAEVDVAGIYDHSTTSVVLGLEDFAFCDRGGAADFVVSGGIGPGGSLPVNTAGGLLSEGYVHGMNTVTEVVRQLRGESWNQVACAEIGLVTSRLGSLILAGGDRR